MNLITLAQAREELWDKGNATTSFDQSTNDEQDAWDRRLNRVVQRFFETRNIARTYRRVDLPIYSGTITLPRDVESLLGIKIISSEECASAPLYVYSRFHEFAEVLPLRSCAPVAQPISEIAQTFRDPEAGFKLRIKGTESNGGTYKFFGGTDADDAQFLDSVELSITNGTTTTTRVWNTMPRLLKSESDNSVELYAVDSDSNETLIAIHAASETTPAYQRYAVPDVGDEYVARILTRLCYVKISADTDIVIPSSFGALQLGLQALRYEDVNDWGNAEKAWAKALDLIDSAKGQLEGAAEIPAVRSVPGFGCANIPTFT